VPLSKYDIQLDLHDHPGTSHAFLVEMVGVNKRVLDVGCDTGYLGEVLAALGNTTTGFEINEQTAEEARKHLVRVEVGDLESTDLVSVFGSAAFDVVVFGDVLEHLRDPLPTLRQAHGLLAPGGSVLISTPNVAHGDVRLALLEGNFRYNSLGILDETHTRFFTRESLVKFVQDAGFAVVDFRRTRAPLFGTEIGVEEDHFDAGLVERLRNDVEATTYQFVVRVVPDDIDQVTSAQALRVDELTAEVERYRHFEADVEDLRHRLLASRDHAIGAEAESGRLRTDNERLTVELVRSRAELDTLRARVPDIANLEEHQRELARMRRLYEELREQAAPLGGVLQDLELARQDLQAAQGNLRSARSELVTTQQRLAATETELGAIRSSSTWRIGRAVVGPLSKLTGRRPGKH
jgi:2-polyprenyl-3-methyl-5-hydroxy-6-metoxy-1,4-benzoquinol methylase